MKKNLVYMLLLLVVGFASCKKDNDNENESQGTIQLGLGLAQQQSKLKSKTSNETPATIVITIADTKGKVAIESKKIALFNMNGSYLSEPLSLKTGDYKITKFLVLNSSDSVIYATPLNGSKLAYLVKTPLPIAFSISKDNVTKVVPEVLSVKNTKPEDFGYNSFSFDVVKTFDFLTTVMVYNESTKNWELTSAQISIKAADSTIAYEGNLDAITNQITLRDNSTSYTLTVSKADYQTYTVTLTANELKLYFRSEDNGPLIIRMIKLQSESTTVTDIDGNEYHTVKIGNQVWMVENLKVTKFNDGTPIPNITDNNAWGALTTPGYCWYNDSISFKNTYGALYNWYVVNTGKIAPQGWHVPSDAEWLTLETYLGGVAVAGIKMKEIGTNHWLSPNTNANNISGFTALPGGFRFSDGSSYILMGIIGIWWSTSLSMELPIAYYLNNNDSWLLTNTYLKTHGSSIRCIKD